MDRMRLASSLRYTAALTLIAPVFYSLCIAPPLLFGHETALGLAALTDPVPFDGLLCLAPAFAYSGSMEVRRRVNAIASSSLPLELVYAGMLTALVLLADREGVAHGLASTALMFSLPFFCLRVGTAARELAAGDRVRAMLLGSAALCAWGLSDLAGICLGGGLAAAAWGLAWSRGMSFEDFRPLPYLRGGLPQALASIFPLAFILPLASFIIHELLLGALGPVDGVSWPLLVAGALLSAGTGLLSLMIWRTGGAPSRLKLCALRALPLLAACMLGLLGEMRFLELAALLLCALFLASPTELADVDDLAVAHVYLPGLLAVAATGSSMLPSLGVTDSDGWGGLIAVGALVALALLSRALPWLGARQVEAEDAARTARVDERLGALGLSDRECSVILALWRGKSLAGAAEELGIARATAGTFAQRAYRKLGVKGKAEALAALDAMCAGPQTEVHGNDGPERATRPWRDSLARFMPRFALGYLLASIVQLLVIVPTPLRLAGSSPRVLAFSSDLPGFAALLGIGALVLLAQTANAGRQAGVPRPLRLAFAIVGPAFTLACLFAPQNALVSQLLPFAEVGWLLEAALCLVACWGLACALDCSQRWASALMALIGGGITAAALGALCPVLVHIGILALCVWLAWRDGYASVGRQAAPGSIADNGSFRPRPAQALGLTLLGAGPVVAGDALQATAFSASPFPELLIPFLALAGCMLAGAPLLRIARIASREHVVATRLLRPLLLATIAGALCESTFLTEVQSLEMVGDPRFIAPLLLLLGSAALWLTITDFGRRLAILEDGAKRLAVARFRTHGLTDTEATVALKLAGGMRPTAVAEELVVSIDTVRTHRRSAYGKLGVHTQGELTAWTYAAVTEGTGREREKRATGTAAVNGDRVQALTKTPEHARK